MTAPSPEVESALRRLAHTYASAVDRRDADAFLSVFTPDAVLTVTPAPESDRPVSRIEGPEQLAKVTVNIARYRRTFHFVGQTTYDVVVDGGAGAETGDAVTGEVYCIAHHLFQDEDINYVMYIRYQDRYARGADGKWRIAERTLLTDWTERRALSADRPAAV